MGLAVTDSIVYTEQLANATLIFLYNCGMLKVTMDKCTRTVQLNPRTHARVVQATHKYSKPVMLCQGYLLLPIVPNIRPQYKLLPTTRDVARA